MGIETGAGLLVSTPVAWELEAREREPEGPGSAKFDVLAEGELFKPMSAKALLRPDTCDGPGLLMGWLIFVDR